MPQRAYVFRITWARAGFHLHLGEHETRYRNTISLPARAFFGRRCRRKVSDEFSVPLCRTHHRALHRSGDEALWWQSTGLDPIRIARRLWRQTRLTNRGRPTRSRSLDRATAASAEPAASVGAPIPSSPALSSQPAAER